MTHKIVDRRKNPQGKALPNQGRFKDRIKREVADAVKRKFSKEGIVDATKDKTKKIKVRASGNTYEPRFRNGEGGTTERILPGNRDFSPGDRIRKPQQQGQGRGGDASADGEGEDSFIFEMTQDEFLKVLFGDCELPNMNKKFHLGEDVFETRRAGFSTDGPPSRMDLVRTMKGAIARNIGITMPLDEEIAKLEAELSKLKSKLKGCDEKHLLRFERRVLKLEKKISELKEEREQAFCFYDIDIRYRRNEKVPVPVAKAVVFFLMDVSGSMGEVHKELAKRFFILLHLFLTKNYDVVDVVFVRHTHTATEVDEDTFFHSRETGGTIVSTALEVMHKIICQRYPVNEWNIYAAQASDGDNLNSDNKYVKELMNDVILPLCQFYSYIEVWDKHEAEMFPDSASNITRLWQELDEVKNTHKNFAMGKVTKVEDIVPIFLKLFRKREKGEV